MSLRTPRARAEGLGPARAGTHHFWVQRITAVALVPLSVWFAVSLARLAGTDFETARGFFAQPLAGALMILFVATALYHLKLGLQVVIEDYIHAEATKIFLLILNMFFTAGVGLAMVLALVKMSFAG